MHNLGFGSQTSHESCSGISRVVLLDETDGRVHKQQKNDTEEVLPVPVPDMLQDGRAGTETQPWTGHRC